PSAKVVDVDETRVEIEVDVLAGEVVVHLYERRPSQLFPTRRSDPILPAAEFGVQYLTRVTCDVSIGERIDSVPIGNETGDGSYILSTLDVGDNGVTSADVVERERDYWRRRYLSNLFDHDHAYRHLAPVRQKQRSWDHLAGVITFVLTERCDVNPFV